jgi:hypothetical protein
MLRVGGSVQSYQQDSVTGAISLLSLGLIQVWVNLTVSRKKKIKLHFKSPTAACFVRRSWRGSNPRRPPRRSMVCTPSSWQLGLAGDRDNSQEKQMTEDRGSMDVTHVRVHFKKQGSLARIELDRWIKYSNAKSWQIITEIGCNDGCGFKRYPWLLWSALKTIDGAAGPKSQNGKMKYTSIYINYISCFLWMLP